MVQCLRVKRRVAFTDRYDPDGSLHLMETRLMISHGLGWSPDHKTFYFTDSPMQKMYAYNFDAVTAKISDRRIFSYTFDADLWLADSVVNLLKQEDGG
ncbi:MULTISPECIES: SMP-30/gluconolactonase/LRE family protein [unclassified Nostoc]|uniref:SMP-30/gluconolactonase/LRE family protein n=1 Tax=unclassified Nostoc TaxID=2593658 RepID=UPI002AD3CC87|nr:MULTISPECIES: SMP-30/gluconolactonase/LRE family protein [unclassified Nostoc]MDZ8125978.1 SMP-30/gluconolactonase/LRE family protein [Nostoc sp. CmiVER01]MDZ8225844.1 SMP-30/gluconolactonase/LRE family protein [Nostoc sp. ChiVER01]